MIYSDCIVLTLPLLFRTTFVLPWSDVYMSTLILNTHPKTSIIRMEIICHDKISKSSVNSLE